MLTALGWQDCQRATLTTETGISLAFEAPIDALYAGCEVNEWAWATVEAHLTGAEPPSFEDARARLQNEIDDEVNPALLALRDAAEEKGVPFVWDDDEVSLGYGVHSETWSSDKIPAVAEIQWSDFAAVPVCSSPAPTARPQRYGYSHRSHVQRARRRGFRRPTASGSRVILSIAATTLGRGCTGRAPRSPR